MIDDGDDDDDDDLFRCVYNGARNRVISRAPGLKLVVQTLLSSLRPIGNIVLICCTFFIIFGILGLQVRPSTPRRQSQRGRNPSNLTRLPNRYASTRNSAPETDKNSGTIWKCAVKDDVYAFRYLILRCFQFLNSLILSF